MEDNIVYFDKDTPKIAQANKVKSLLAVNGDDDTIGSVEFDLLVLEAGKKVGDSVKLTGLVLPELGEANKTVKVLGGTTGKTYTYGATTIDIPANYEALLFWDGVEQTWSKQDEAPLPSVELANNFDDFSVGKSSSAEQSGILNTYNKLFFSTSTDPYIDAGILTFSTCYIFSFGTAYLRLTAGTFDLNGFFTENSSQDRFAVCVKSINLLKRNGGTVVVTSSDLFVVRYDQTLDLPNKESVVLFYYDRSTGILQSPFISVKMTVDNFNNRSSNLTGSSSNDYFLNTYDKLFFSMRRDPRVRSHVISWDGGYIFNGANNYLILASGSLDLNSYITTPTADRFVIYIDAFDLLRRSGGGAVTITALSLKVARFGDSIPYEKGNVILFEYDVSNAFLRSPFSVPIKGAEIGINMHKYQYSSRSGFSFNSANHSISWTERLYIFNRSRGTTSSSYLRIEPGSISFADKIAALPTDNWFTAYINTGILFQTGDPLNSVSVTPENIIIKGWTEDVTELRQRDYIVLFNYDALQKTIESPFLNQYAHTKALESTVTSITSQPWFNKYPNVQGKLSAFFGKYMYSLNQDAQHKTRIILLGNSLLARHQHTSTLNIDPKTNPPCLTTKNFGAYLFETLKGNKPFYRRYDSGFITEHATFDLVESNSGWDDSGDIYSAVKNSNIDNASISFTVSTEYDFFNFIDRKHRVLPSTALVVSVSSGNGVLECRFEGETLWNEANGFSFSQQHPAANSASGIGNTQFQRRIEFRKVSSGIGSETSITITNTVPSTNFYYWGVELIPTGKRYTQLINVARGGHTLNQLKPYIQTDVFDRKPDLIVLEVPLLNMVNDNVDIEFNVNQFVDFVYGDRVGFANPLSLKNKSNNWTDFQVLVIIPQHSRPHFNSSSQFVVQSSGYTIESLYNAIKGELFSRGDIPFVDLSTAFMEAIKADPLYNGDYWNAMRSSGVTGDGYVNDGLHQNNKGTLVWAKEICPIFWGNTN